ncbi:helix-turn-helix transcriptional regulator [Mucilaginibacter daejeonensis]|uniref:helix-turn-helix domain-containing protein n=1 Tax=Mucilaginibacter daejeonensis TaxID=398049 RepID=UPI001D1761A1|nr:helix-turn-helix transcriptional regulator [Mucilaginibacter daejeonensis]UEG54200.1 helix-turn-helix transcriptional regulator [Mucilaginibacter daejeonensis]
MAQRSVIPVSKFGNEPVSIERFSFSDLPELGDWQQPERHDRHSFFLMEQGTVTLEIDFTKSEVVAPAVVYMHPDQVHRILAFSHVQAVAWALTDEQLGTGYLNQLQSAAPEFLDEASFDLMQQLAEVCLKMKEPALKPALLALVSLVIEKLSAKQASGRFEVITHSFRKALESHYLTAKRPADYASFLNISVAYLNECVKNTTGLSVSHHIQQRVILEAKRLLVHSDLSVKEIASYLGYDDHPYFVRLFAKVAGKSALAFKNRD